jgi:transcriptional antiterminator RfaH
MNAAAGCAWHVVHTHAHAEAKAVAHLMRQGYEVYLPRYLKRRRHARRVETVCAPLFPRYCFVYVDRLVQRWRTICSTVGVAHLVCNGDEPAAVPALIIDEIRRREDERGFVRLDPAPRFAPGDKVRVVGGALADCLGLFQDMADRERVTVLIDLLGRKVKVTLDAATLDAA